MSKVKTIGESQSFKNSFDDLKTRKQLILEARYALQKVLDAERESNLFTSAMNETLLGCYRDLEPILEVLDAAIGDIAKIVSCPTKDVDRLVLEKLADICEDLI